MADLPIHVELGGVAYTGTVSPDAPPPPPPPNQPPIAMLSISPTNVQEGGTVTFSAVGSSDPENDPLIFTIDPGTGVGPQPAPGGTLTVTAPQVTADTQFVATLTVSDGAHTATKQAPWTIMDVPPPPPPPPPPPTPTFMYVDATDHRILRFKDGTKVKGGGGLEGYWGTANFPTSFDSVPEMARCRPRVIRVLPTVPEQNLTATQGANFAGCTAAQIADLIAKAKATGKVVDLGIAGGSLLSAWGTYRSQWIDLDAVLHARGESYAADLAAWKAEAKQTIDYMRGLGAKQPLQIMANNGGRNWRTLRDGFAELYDYDPLHNLIGGVQLYWPSAKGDYNTITGNTSMLYQQLSGCDIKTAIDQIAAFPYRIHVGVCTDQGDMPNNSVPYKGIISYLANYPDLLWYWWCWSSGGPGSMAMNWIWAGPLSTDPVPPGRTLGTWANSASLDGRSVAETLIVRGT